jgi:hypothetical protein
LPQRDDRERSAQPQGSAACDIARGDESMIPFVMATERIAGFEHLVGRWDEAQHRSALADGRHAYFIAWDRTEPIGFVILRDWASPERTTLVKRIAVCQPGRGHGRALLSKVETRSSCLCCARNGRREGRSQGHNCHRARRFRN